MTQSRLGITLAEAIKDLLPAQASFLNNLILPHEGYALYQVYVFMLILEAAKKEGAKVYFGSAKGEGKQLDLFNTNKNNQVSTSNKLTFRKKPGQIYSKVNDKNQEYLYAILDFSKAPDYVQKKEKDSRLEVHLGVRVKGKSGILHECDVCVLESKKADTCRNKKLPPKHTEIKLAVECKCYESEGLGIGLGREFIGLTTEFSKNKEKMLFVASSSSNNTKMLLTNRSREWRFNVLPYTNDIQTFISYCETSFQKYKAR